MGLDLLLVGLLGFLGSFGHCASMCGPLVVAFSLSHQAQTSNHNFRFHLLLNLGRIASYAGVGAGLGLLGSVLVAGGQLAGIGSSLRGAIAIFTGILLIWFGIGQINPQWLPKIPLLHPLKGALHQKLQGAIEKTSAYQWWTPAAIGMLWGLFPCGFLYAAQIKAAQTSSWWVGALTMLAFGFGTMPIMLGVGVSAAKLSSSRRSQLFRLGGWITLMIGILTLLRTDAANDWTGHGSLVLLALALIARPIRRWWSAPLQYRRAIGVGAFVLAVAHTGHMMSHSLDWNLAAVRFMLAQHRWGLVCGITALLLMLPAAATSFDRLQQALGKFWRSLHLLCVPALVLAAVHTILLGSHYWGNLNSSWLGSLRVVIVIGLTATVLILRRFSISKPSVASSK